MLKIGLPAGAEFALMGLYMGVVYAITKPFGAPAQGGFTIGLRVVQSAFLPIVALGFAVAPVAGQNFAAGKGDRVRAAFKTAASMAAAFMLLIAVGMYFGAAAVMRIFTKDPDAIAVGVQYLRIVVVTFVPSGITFVSSSMFQALGNTIPPLATSTLRILIAAIPAIFLARLAGFASDVDLVPGRRGDLAADDAEPDPAAARIQIEAGRRANADAPGSRRRYNHPRVKLAVPKECRPGERRVAVTPENVARLIKMGFAVAVEHDAGAARLVWRR